MVVGPALALEGLQEGGSRHKPCGVQKMAIIGEMTVVEITPSV